MVFLRAFKGPGQIDFVLIRILAQVNIMISRRKFLKGSGALFTLAGTGITISLSPRGFAGQSNANSLVMLFFRGVWMP
jgi:hypothetical protein